VRDPQSAVRLDAAIRRGDMASVKSLRRDAQAEDERCWLHAADVCPSRLTL